MDISSLMESDKFELIKMKILNLEIQIDEAKIKLKLSQMKSNNRAYFARVEGEEENLISELITNEKEKEFLTASKELSTWSHSL